MAERQDRHTGRNTMIRFPDPLYDRLQAAAEDHEVAVNWLVNKAVRDYLDRLLPAEEVRWTRDPPH